MVRLPTLAVLLSLAAPAVAFAQAPAAPPAAAPPSSAGTATPTASPGVPPMTGMAHPDGGAAAAAAEMHDAMQRMHAAMDMPSSGNPDRDFVMMMIPHHQGAVDMARIELHYGHDPALRQLARQIIAAQQKEIALMKRWQVKHGEKHAE